MTAADYVALPHSCAWAGCPNSYPGEVQPPDWTSLIVTGPFNNHAVFNIKVPPNGKCGTVLYLDALEMRHDTVLCPQHSVALGRLLK